MREFILRLNLSCNQNCIFCNIRGKKDEHSFNYITAKKKIDELSSNSKDLVVLFTGGEPTLNPYLINLIKYAKKRGIEGIGIQTNAMLCCYQYFTQRLRRSGLTHAFVPFYSSDKKTFDALTRTPGSFKHAVQGIKNLQNQGVFITFNILVNSLNYQQVPETIKFIHRNFKKVIKIDRKKNINVFSFSFVQPAGLAWENRWIVPKMSKVAPYVIQAMKYCQEKNISFMNSGCGFPLCFLKGFEEYSMEYQCIQQNRKNQSNLFDYNKASKVYGKQCQICKLKKYCFGVWKSYAEIYGLDELKPYC